MKWYKRAWSEVQRGENIELYVTVVFAVALVALTIVPLPDDLSELVDSFVPALTIVVLALLAVSMVGTRHRLDDILSRTEKTEGITFLEHLPNTLGQEIAAANELWFVGVTMEQSTRKHLTQIEQVLRRGGTFHVLVTQPDSAALEVADARSYLSTGVSTMSSTIRHTLAICCQLRTKYPAQIDVHTIAYPLDHAIIAMDIRSSSGLLYVSNYIFRTPGGSKPKFLITADQPSWYDLYRSELELLFSASQPWDCQSHEA